MAKKKKRIDIDCSRGIHGFLCRVRKVLSKDRPTEIDEDLAEIRKIRQEAEEILKKTRATLDGEDNWFIKRDDDGTHSNTNH